MKIHTFIHNSNIVRGVCGACRKAEGTWTVSGSVSTLGSISSAICDECLKTFDIPAWSIAAEKRILAAPERRVSE